MLKAGYGGLCSKLATDQLLNAVYLLLQGNDLTATDRQSLLDTILLGPDQQEIDTLVKKLGKTFKIEDQGELSDYLGIKIERKPDGILECHLSTRYGYRYECDIYN